MYYPEGNYFDGSEQYYGEHGQTHQGQGQQHEQAEESTQEQGDQREDTHFLQDFGY